MTPETRRATTLYRYGVRTAPVRRGKNLSARDYRRGLADVTFGPVSRDMLLRRIRSGVPLPDAAALANVSPAQVYGRARWDPGFRDRLDDALDEWSRPWMGHRCGTPTGYRGGCRCRRCRRAHSDETDRYRLAPAGTS